MLPAPLLGAEVAGAPEANELFVGLELNDVDDALAAFAVYGRRISESPFVLLFRLPELVGTLDMRFARLSLELSVKDVPDRRGGGGGGTFLLAGADDVPAALGSLGADAPFHNADAAGRLLYACASLLRAVVA